MKKTVFCVLFFLLAVFLPAQETPAPEPSATPDERPELPSTGKFGGVWSGTINHTVAGQQYRDTYSVILYDNGSCWVTIKTQENGRTLTQEDEGIWSYDHTILKIECEFLNPEIPRIRNIKWLSVYQLENGDKRLTILVKPSASASSTVKLVLNKL